MGMLLYLFIGPERDKFKLQIVFLTRETCMRMKFVAPAAEIFTRLEKGTCCLMLDLCFEQEKITWRQKRV